jgi:hypothetical protein
MASSSAATAVGSDASLRGRMSKVAPTLLATSRPSTTGSGLRGGSALARSARRQ